MIRNIELIKEEIACKYSKKKINCVSVTFSLICYMLVLNSFHIFNKFVFCFIQLIGMLFNHLV